MNIRQRKDIARYLLSKDDVFQGELESVESVTSTLPRSTMFGFNYPDNLEPTPIPITPKPHTSDSLPKVDIIVIT